MKTEQQYEVVPQTEQQRIDGAIDTALLNADLLREQVAELEQALLAETQAKHEAVECPCFYALKTVVKTGRWKLP